MHLCKRWVWKNAYSSIKSVERPINLYIILFDNQSPFQKSVFVILSIFLQTYQTNMKKYFCKKMYFDLECIYAFFTFNFVIWQVVCEYSQFYKFTCLFHYSQV